MLVAIREHRKPRRDACNRPGVAACNDDEIQRPCMPRYRRVRQRFRHFEDLPGRRARFGPENGKEAWTLAVPCTVLEPWRQQRRELIAIELTDMEGIDDSVLISVLDFVGTG